MSSQREWEVAVARQRTHQLVADTEPLLHDLQEVLRRAHELLPDLGEYTEREDEDDDA